MQFGTNGLDENAVKKLYKVKKRSLKNPINLLVNNLEMIEKITNDISPIEYKLIKAFFPGPFTIILKKNKLVPNIVTANSEYVGVRIPDNEIAKKLIDYANVPIAAPSANISGNLSSTNIEDLKNDFLEQVDYVTNGGKSKIGFESTIVQVIDNVPHILRPGFITPEQIKSIIGCVVLENDENALLPSSKIKHYELRSNSIVVYSENPEKMAEKILEISKKNTNSRIICFEENIKFYEGKISDKLLFPTSFKDLFSTLIKVDNSYPDIVLIEGVKKEGIGIAIMNRLLKACNNNYLNID